MRKRLVSAACVAGWSSVLRPMAERVAFLIYLVLAIAAGSGLGLGAIQLAARQDPRVLLAGIGAALLAVLLRKHGERVWSFRRWEESLEMGPGERHPADAAEAELASLLAALESPGAAEESRDVWRVLALRRQARALLEEHPELRQRYERELARHPDLR